MKIAELLLQCWKMYLLVISPFLAALGTLHVSADSLLKIIFILSQYLTFSMTLAFCVDVLLIASILGVIPALDAHSQVTLTC